MKTFFLFIALLASGPAFANFKITDAAIIGEYKVTASSPLGDLETVQIRYNEENVLVADFIETEIQLPIQDLKKDLIYDEAQEFNCEDSGCGGVSYISISLKSTRSKGKDIPQLSITITESWPVQETDEFSEDATTYVFNWSKALPDGGLSPYTVGENSPEIKAFHDECVKTVNDGGYSPFPRNVCPTSITYGYRDLDRAFAATIQNTPTEVTPSAMDQAYYDKIEAAVKKVNTKNRNQLKLALEAVDKLKKFINAFGADKIYIADNSGMLILILVKEKEQTYDMMWVSK